MKIEKRFIEMIKHKSLIRMKLSRIIFSSKEIDQEVRQWRKLRWYKSAPLISFEKLYPQVLQNECNFSAN